jgi:c-di-GMP-binding flagellar brake protein YcgR
MASAFEGVNLRQTDRKLVRVPAVVTTADGSQCEARTLNISATGMALVAAVNFNHGTRIEVSFRLPTEQVMTMIKLPGEVRNCVLSGADSGFRIGLEFSNVPAATQSVLQKFLR